MFFVQEKAEYFGETWDVYADIDEAKLLHGPRRGDLRFALAPFLANRKLMTRPAHKTILGLSFSFDISKLNQANPSTSLFSH